MPIPDEVAGPDIRPQHKEDPLNVLVHKVQSAANAALSGSITLDEWETTVDIITGASKK